MSTQYDLYLQRHRENVRKGFDWIRSNLPELLAEGVEWQIEFAHDASKNETDEYRAYDRYFYGNNKSYRVVQEYRRAWLLHIHRNPHHWQYWVLINDDPDEGAIALDMPYNYILEMICDWWSFSWQKGDLTEIFRWYDEHKDYIKLSTSTRKSVETILEKIAAKLAGSELAHHGVKGQKWGVLNGPPYPIDRSSKQDTTIKDAIESGEVSKKINRDKQKRHTKDGHLPGRSYIDGDLEYAQKLVDELSGTGEALINGKTGEWLHKEKVASTHNIGTHVDSNGVKTETNKAMICYSKTGTHIYPRKEEE